MYCNFCGRTMADDCLYCSACPICLPNYRRMLEVQARQLWRFVRGEAAAYHGFTTR